MDPNTPNIADTYFLVKKLVNRETYKIMLAFASDLNKHVALKIMKKRLTFDKQSMEYQKERESLLSVRHDNVIRLEDENRARDILFKQGKSKLVDYFVLEYAENGDLWDYIYPIHKGFGEKISRYIFFQLLNGIEACHNAGRYHMNLNFNSLQMTRDWVLKISNFGNSEAFVGETNLDIIHRSVSTLRFYAPEILSWKPHDGSCADIFAMGVILFHCVTGEFPFTEARSINSIYRYISSHEYETFWEQMSYHIIPVSEEFKSLTSLMLAYNPIQRPSIVEIREHPWLKGEIPTYEEVRTELEDRKQRIQMFTEVRLYTETKHKQGGSRVNRCFKSSNEGYTSNTELSEIKSVKYFDSGYPYRMKFFAPNAQNTDILMLLIDYFETETENAEIELHEAEARLRISYPSRKEYNEEDLQGIELENLILDAFLSEIDQDTFIVELHQAKGDKLAFLEAYESFSKFLDQMK